VRDLAASRRVDPGAVAGQRASSLPLAEVRMLAIRTGNSLADHIGSGYTLFPERISEN